LPEGEKPRWGIWIAVGAVGLAAAGGIIYLLTRPAGRGAVAPRAAATAGGNVTALAEALGAVTKKDFQAMARILCAHGASTSLAAAVASYFGSQNPRFDELRFIRATQTCPEYRRAA
jgi:hypothetical protein